MRYHNSLSQKVRSYFFNKEPHRGLFFLVVPAAVEHSGLGGLAADEDGS